MNKLSLDSSLERSLKRWQINLCQLGFDFLGCSMRWNMINVCCIQKYNEKTKSNPERMTMAFRSSVCCHNTQYKIITQNHLIINLQCKFIITIKRHKWLNTIKINKLSIGKWVYYFSMVLFYFYHKKNDENEKFFERINMVGKLMILPISKCIWFIRSNVLIRLISTNREWMPSENGQTEYISKVIWSSSSS